MCGAARVVRASAQFEAALAAHCRSSCRRFDLRAARTFSEAPTARSRHSHRKSDVQVNSDQRIHRPPWCLLPGQGVREGRTQPATSDTAASPELDERHSRAFCPAPFFPQDSTRSRRPIHMLHCRRIINLLAGTRKELHIQSHSSVSAVARTVASSRPEFAYSPADGGRLLLARAPQREEPPLAHH